MPNRRGPCPECHMPGQNREIRKLVTLPSGKMLRLCYYCASGYESVSGAVIETLTSEDRDRFNYR